MIVNDLGVPTFGRLEIRMRDKATLRKSAKELRRLAETLETIVADNEDEGTAMLLAYRKIRAVSDTTRKGG